MDVKATVRWLRAVGALYIVLTAFNLVMLFANPSFYQGWLPYPGNDLAVRAFTDAWLVFILELGALGIAMLVASRDPHRTRWLVVAILGAELARGILADVIWIARGYSLPIYAGFIVLHLVVIGTGILALRSEGATASARLEADRL